MSVITCKRVQVIPMIIKIIKKRYVHCKYWKENETPAEIKSEPCDILSVRQISQVVTKTHNLSELSTVGLIFFHLFLVIFNVFNLFRKLVGDLL